MKVDKVLWGFLASVAHNSTFLRRVVVKFKMSCYFLRNGKFSGSLWSNVTKILTKELCKSYFLNHFFFYLNVY